MPKGLYIEQPEQAHLKDYEEPPLGAREYRLRTELGTIKQGTEFGVYSGKSPFQDRDFDAPLRLFVPRPPGAPSITGGRFAGNMVVGVVAEVGSAVSRVKPGDRLFMHGTLCESQTRRESDGQALDGMRSEDALCLDPALFALGALRDGRIGLGDDVALFGLGAIGLMGIQLLRLAGCRRIVAVDPLESRRRLAQTLGADVTLDPLADDVPRAVRLAFGRGADVAVEASGQYPALASAIRSVRQCGRVVTLGYYKGRDSQIELGAEFFHNRVEILASLPDWGNPLRDAPLWDRDRLWATLAGWFAAGKLTARGILDPIVPFADSPQAFLRAYREPGFAVKLGVRFGTGNPTHGPMDTR